MRRGKKDLPVLEKVLITDYAAEGKALAKFDNKVLFVPFVCPGDVVDVKVTVKRSSYLEGKALKFHTFSSIRTEPFCSHFSVCGGCKWQHIPYAEQLKFKEQQVLDQLNRIGNLQIESVLPIIGSEKTKYYRNKLEFTFSNLKWLTDFNKEISFSELNMNALGFHIPKMFDRVLDLENCYLQKEPSNSIRLLVKKFTDDNHYEYFDIRKKQGFLRNIILRNTSTNQWMVILVFFYEDNKRITELMNFIERSFPEIPSLMYVINEKSNDTIYDLPVQLYKGNPFITEEMEGLSFKIGPKSFYQTNSDQAYNLYKTARDFAGFTGKEIVYDLYTGTGTIANFIAKNVSKVIGIESVPEAIDDANENSRINRIENTKFFAGDMLDVLNEDFVKGHGKPDVIITDPPRAGMHVKVVEQILNILPQKVIYISCNPATQARDVALMSTHYKVIKIQAVDMFPHTHHVENVMLLELKK